MSVNYASSFLRIPVLPRELATDTSAAGQYQSYLHRWCVDFWREYKTTINAVIDNYLPLDGSADMTGNLVFNGASLRIQADMSNATLSHRIAWQTSTANGVTSLSVLPNGTATQSGINIYSNSNADAAQSIATLLQNGTATTLQASTANGGTQGTVALVAAATPAVTVQANTDVTLGPSGAATTMSAGFAYIPSAAGAPTGTPTARTGYVPLYYDATNNALYAYNGAWKKVTLA